MLAWPQVYETFSTCSTQLSIKFIMLIHVKMTKIIMLMNFKMPTIVGILTFISMIIESLKARKIFIIHNFSFYGQLKSHAQLS